MTQKELLNKITKAYQDVAPRFRIEVYDALIEDLAFDYVEDGTPSLEFFGMKSRNTRKELVEFFRVLLQSICLSNGIVFFYSPADVDL